MNLPEIAETVRAAAAIDLLRSHPLLASILGFFGAIALILGVLHELRILGELLIALLQQCKRELAEVHDVLLRLKRELSRWKLEP